MTNVNFDADVHLSLLKTAQKIKETLRRLAPKNCAYPEAAQYDLSETREEILKETKRVGIMHDQSPDADIRSLQQTVVHGLKGISAYGHHAGVLGFKNDQIDHFYFRALAALARNAMPFEEMLRLLMRTGDISVLVIQRLDDAHTKTYENPQPQKVNTRPRKGPFIIVSGHDLKDLELLLKAMKGKGIHIYTHGEMLPAHGYPKFKQYKHLVGNYGGAWQDQQKEFDNIPGCNFMTTNCLMRPRESYKDRIFSTGVVGWDGVKHIETKADGGRDFSEIIEKALALGGFEENEPPKEILVGFGHHATLEHAAQIVEAVKTGRVRHFFLIGGCDGARPGRNYYSDFARLVPDDCVILTLACGKYRFNKIDFGDIDGLPRLLDLGQCNDAYSAVRIATALADAFDTDVNGLPLSIALYPGTSKKPSPTSSRCSRSA